MPKLTLRDLFAFVTVVALWFGWWTDHARQDREYNTLNARCIHLATEMAAWQAEAERQLALAEAWADAQASDQPRELANEVGSVRECQLENLTARNRLLQTYVDNLKAGWESGFMSNDKIHLKPDGTFFIGPTTSDQPSPSN